ncbi:MAG: response regulator [Cyclobacteriaceae bacterium]|nr:response regulator [Cyclobacteriaceae bacterium]
MSIVVLVVDDSRTNILALSAVLRTKDIQVVNANNGQDGIAKIKEHPEIDVVLMDIMMPVMDGYEAMRIIRRDLNSKVPVIALTASNSPDDERKCLEAGATDFCSKPVDLETLYKKITNCLIS